VTAPYLLVSDIHAHKWSAFATIDGDGANSRLKAILSELERGAAELKKRGGNIMVIAGDLFHVRGSVDPEVFNLTHRCIRAILETGVSIYAIPGNHDLAGRETTEIGNAFQSFDSLENFQVHGSIQFHDKLAFIPWCASLALLRTQIAELKDWVQRCGENTNELDLIIHAGIDGVLSGVPASGLTHEEIASWGFKRVFAGHYHHHLDFGNSVYSIGALTHQTWSDIGTKAGFLFVYPDRVDYAASHAPSFIEITGDDAPEDIPMMVPGNYVRVRSMKLTEAEITKFRGELEGMGAAGVTFQVARETVTARAGAAATAGLTLDQSVDKFIDGMELEDKTPVKAMALDVLSTVRSVAA
jgi:DNA repair exonuclease SbcCD nuclease subunit